MFRGIKICLKCNREYMVNKPYRMNISKYCSLKCQWASCLSGTHNLGRHFSEEHRRKIGEFWKGKKHSEEHKKKQSEGIKKHLPITAYKKGHIPYSKLHPEIMPRGEKHHSYINGWKLSREGINKWNKEWYRKKPNKKLSNQIRIFRKLGGGELTKQTIQQIYEDNIKQYGTLTCYLCLKTIQFGKDSLEHKIPLSRGGTNQKENLAIAHKSCNSRKRNRTYEEFIKMEA